MSNIGNRKRFGIPLLIALAAGAAAGLAASAITSFAPGTAVAAEQASSTVAIEIPEVSCASCSVKARKAVKAAGGVIRIGEGDPKNRLVVTFEPGPGRPAAYVDALRKAGFPKAQRVASK